MGSAWPALLGFLLVPVYLRYMGVEAYGLVGAFTSMQVLISLLDLGLSTTTSREVALSIGVGSEEEKVNLRNLLRTLETIYFAIALLIALAVLLASGWIATAWLNPEILSIETVQLAAIIFGLNLALRWPVAIYNGVLQGAEKQVLLNGLTIGIGTVRSVGSALILIFVSPTVLAFLFWQTAVAVVELLIMVNISWKVIPNVDGHHPAFTTAILRKVWKFSLSVAGISLLATLIKQMDRLLISALMPLKMVGYYTTAYNAYLTLSIFAVPFSAAAFPRFASLLSQNNTEALISTYRKTIQSLTFLAVPAACILVYFSYDVLLLWTGSEDIAAHTHQTLSILALAFVFNIAMQIPMSMQMAVGITHIALWVNLIAFPVLTPLMYFLIRTYGIEGAGLSWLIYNVLYYSIAPHVYHRYIPDGRKISWFFRDTFSFIFVGLFIFGLFFLLKFIVEKSWISYLGIVLGSVFYVVLNLILFRSLRDMLNGLVAPYPFLQRLNLFSRLKL